MCSSGKGEDTYPDLLALFIALLVTVIIALGVRNSVGFNNVLNVVNLVVWVFMIIAGLFFLSAKNWESGNFLPYGWSGVRYNGVMYNRCSEKKKCKVQIPQVALFGISTSTQIKDLKAYSLNPIQDPQSSVNLLWLIR